MSKHLDVIDLKANATRAVLDVDKSSLNDVQKTIRIHKIVKIQKRFQQKIEKIFNISISHKLLEQGCQSVASMGPSSPTAKIDRVFGQVKAQILTNYRLPSRFRKYWLNKLTQGYNDTKQKFLQATADQRASIFKRYRNSLIAMKKAILMDFSDYRLSHLVTERERLLKQHSHIDAKTMKFTITQMNVIKKNIMSIIKGESNLSKCRSIEQNGEKLIDNLYHKMTD